jgi:hypothetical protein
MPDIISGTLVSEKFSYKGTKRKVCLDKEPFCRRVGRDRNTKNPV